MPPNALIMPNIGKNMQHFINSLELVIKISSVIEKKIYIAYMFNLIKYLSLGYSTQNLFVQKKFKLYLLKEMYSIVAQMLDVAYSFFACLFVNLGHTLNEKNLVQECKTGHAPSCGVPNLHRQAHNYYFSKWSQNYTAIRFGFLYAQLSTDLVIHHRDFFPCPIDRSHHRNSQQLKGKRNSVWCSAIHVSHLYHTSVSS